MVEMVLSSPLHDRVRPTHEMEHSILLPLYKLRTCDSKWMNQGPRSLLSMCTFTDESPLMEFNFPGFRFHPTEEELLNYYLKNTVLSRRPCFDTIGFLNIYCHEPWDLPGLAKIGEREWYFFVARESKNGIGGKPSRTTGTGYWKATGSDRPVRCLEDPKRLLGHRKTLVFYQGRAPKGCKTDWVMNEYRLPSSFSSANKEDLVLCKVYRKATSLKVLEQRAEVARASQVSSSYVTEDNISSYDESLLMKDSDQSGELKLGMGEEGNSVFAYSGSTKDKLSELQLPTFSMDWTEDPLWALLKSPALEIPLHF